MKINLSPFEKGIELSVRYLNSEQALKAIATDPYWPKWNSPWWHMLLFYEMGLSDLIPANIVKALIISLNKIPLKIFPIYPEELPEGTDPDRGSFCHCQLGNVYQVLFRCGVNVDEVLPWIRPWFLKYQMADGGLNCDNTAYLINDAVPSSMVGTIAAFEAILLCTPREWTDEEIKFLNKGAQFLMRRKLILGSETKHNASEQISAKNWTKLCFPRFYYYDVLRGLNALLAWSEKTKQPIPIEAIQDTFLLLNKQFPNGEVRIGRRSFEGVGTIFQNETGEWIRKPHATSFPLLDMVSRIGEPSPFLSSQWQRSLQLMHRSPDLNEWIASI